jgi:hypothetical protein
MWLGVVQKKYQKTLLLQKNNTRIIFVNFVIYKKRI